MHAPNEKSTRPDNLSHHTLRGRLWRYGPLALWIGLIFFASTGNLSASNTSRFMRPLLLWLFPDISLSDLLFVNFLVRKAAHITEYALLALLAARAFLTSSHDKLRTKWFIAAFALVAVCALLDEYHQSFLGTRTSTIYDSLIDMCGGAIALALVLLWRSCRRSKAGGISPGDSPRRRRGMFGDR